MYFAHDENNECAIGDLVVIKECQRLSKKKYFTVTEIVDKVPRVVDPETGKIVLQDNREWNCFRYKYFFTWMEDHNMEYGNNFWMWRWAIEVTFCSENFDSSLFNWLAVILQGVKEVYKFILKSIIFCYFSLKKWVVSAFAARGEVFKLSTFSCWPLRFSWSTILAKLASLFNYSQLFTSLEETKIWKVIK